MGLGHAEIGQEQGRIRENMKTVTSGSAYYERLLAKLNEQEGQIERLHSERDDLLKKRDAQQKALEDYLSGLTVEWGIHGGGVNRRAAQAPPNVMWRDRRPRPLVSDTGGGPGSRRGGD